MDQNKRIDTTMGTNEFYANFGTNILYVIGIELDKFYNHTVNVLKVDNGWTTKDHKEIKFMISVFKNCKDGFQGLDDECRDRFYKDVGKAISLLKKHWLGLWN